MGEKEEIENLMALFGKSREEEEYEEKEELELRKKEKREGKKFSRNLKDLNPVNKKKRKEPPKPWGKKERLLVLAVFAGLSFTSAMMALKVREFKFPGIPRISFENIKLGSIFKNETIVIEKNSTDPERSGRREKVIEYFTKETGELSGKYGLLVNHWDNGGEYGVNSEDVFQGASLLKVPLMILIYRESENGNLDLGKEYVLKNSDKISGSGFLDDKPEGNVYTFKQLVEYMGKSSDRTSYGVMKSIVGDEKYESFIKETGMTTTSITTGETTPKDMALLFSKLWKGELVSDKSRDEILSFLTNTIYEDHIPAGLPGSVKTAHKYGEDSGVVNDAGIVFAGNPYILVLMGEGIIPKDAEKLYSDVSRYIYDIENNVQ